MVRSSSYGTVVRRQGTCTSNTWPARPQDPALSERRSIFLSVCAFFRAMRSCSLSARVIATASCYLCSAPSAHQVRGPAGKGASTAAHRFVVTLERSTGTSFGKDEAIVQRCSFDAEVHPDLAPAITIRGLIKLYASRVRTAFLRSRGQTQNRTKNDHYSTSACKSKTSARYVVRSVPVQVSRGKELRHRLAAAAGVDSDGQPLDDGSQPSNALLLLSGDHPWRRLPIVGSIFPDVFDELRIATSMRDSGLLPKELELWAVANPLLETGEAGINRVRKKVELGADVIVTQPPLAWKPFERWLRDVAASRALRRTEQAGISNPARISTGSKTGPSRHESAGSTTGEDAKLLVGMPVITSPQGLRFWLKLCGVSNHRRICEEAFGAFEDDGASTGTSRRPAIDDLDSQSGRDNLRRDIPCERRNFGQEWFKATMSKIRCLDDLGVSGVHVMAPGEGPRRRLENYIVGELFARNRH